MSQLLRVGSRGKEVKAGQDSLNFHVQRGKPLQVDGIFGPLTNARVQEFQKSNALAVDGIVGPNTRRKLFEMAQVEAALLFLPRLKLETPSLSLHRGLSGSRFGMRPQLGPSAKLNVPGFGLLPLPLGSGQPPPTLLPGPHFFLSQASVTGLPPLQGPTYVFRFRTTVPQRNDPADPHVRSYQNIVSLISGTGLGTGTKNFLVSLVPKPITVFTPPVPGFNWGAAPLFDPFDPTGFGVKGNAAFTFQVSDGAHGLPHIVFGAWGKGRAFLDFSSKKGESKPRIELGGRVFLGATGVF